MSIYIIGPDGEERNNNGTNNITVPESYEMPENEVEPGLEIITPDGQQEQPILHPVLIPHRIPQSKRIHEILGDN